MSLEGVEASLAAKSKELQEVLSQLQAAAAQEFQDAKKLLLEEGGLLRQDACRGNVSRSVFKGCLVVSGVCCFVAQERDL